MNNTKIDGLIYYLLFIFHNKKRRVRKDCQEGKSLVCAEMLFILYRIASIIYYRISSGPSVSKNSISKITQRPCLTAVYGQRNRFAVYNLWLRRHTKWLLVDWYFADLAYLDLADCRVPHLLWHSVLCTALLQWTFVNSPHSAIHRIHWHQATDTSRLRD